MNRRTRPSHAIILSALGLAVAGCGILSPRDSIVVTGTVRVGSDPTSGIQVSLYRLDTHWRSDSSIQGGRYETRELLVGSDWTAEDGTYRVDEEIDHADCDRGAIVRAVGRAVTAERALRTSCGEHEDLDFRLPG